MRNYSAAIILVYSTIFTNVDVKAQDLVQRIGMDNSSAGLVSKALPDVRQISYRLPVVRSVPLRLIISEEASEPLSAPDETTMGPKEFEKIAEDTEVVVERRSLPEWEEIRTYEMAYQALNVVDAVQTVVALRSNKAREMNPILGANPSTITVIGYKAAWGGAHYLLTRWIMRERPELARVFQFASIAVQGSTVAWNMTRVF